MGAVYFSQSCYKPRQIFNLERESTLVGRCPVVQIRCRRVVSACLNVDVDAPNTGNTTSEKKKTKDVIEMEGMYLVGTYARTPVVLERGEGCKLYDVEGNEYLDLSAGIAVNALGHGDADWLKAVVEQAGTLTHTSNIFHTIPQVRACYYMFVSYINVFICIKVMGNFMFTYQYLRYGHTVSCVFASEFISISSSICIGIMEKIWNKLLLFIYFWFV